jgi:hypothetical protein
MAFKLKEDKLEIRIEPKETTLDPNFSTSKGSYTHSLPISDITEETWLLDNIRKAIGSICAKVVNSLTTE